MPVIRWVGRDMPYRTHASMSDVLAERYPDIWGKRIEPLGVRTPEETSALERSAAFVVIPSLWDVFNLATVEALAFGKVVIVSSGAGAAGLMTDGVNGFVYPAGDAPALAVAPRAGRRDGCGRAPRNRQTGPASRGTSARSRTRRDGKGGRLRAQRSSSDERAPARASANGCGTPSRRVRGRGFAERARARGLARPCEACRRLESSVASAGGAAAVAAALGAARVGRGAR